MQSGTFLDIAIDGHPSNLCLELKYPLFYEGAVGIKIMILDFYD